MGVSYDISIVSGSIFVPEFLEIAPFTLLKGVEFSQKDVHNIL